MGKGAVDRFVAVRLAVSAVVTSIALCLAAPPAWAGWIDGGLAENNYTENCQVVGNPYVEHATAQYVSYYAPDAGGVLKVGEIYYVRVVVAALGNPCGSPFGVDLQVHLPANTYLAVDSSNPIYCLLQTRDGTWHSSDSQGYGCPQSASAGDWSNPPSGWLRFDPASGAPLWPMVQGQAVQLQIPVFSTAPLAGLGDNGSFLVGAINATPASASKPDGTPCAIPNNCGADAPRSGWNYNGTPAAGPWQAVAVDYNPPTIDYPSPSSSSVTASSAHTTGNLNDWFVPGTVYTDLGMTTSYGTSHSDAIDGNYTGYHVDQDWNNLSGATTYHWRLRFVPQGGSPACSPSGSATCGVDQTFTTDPGPSASGGPGAGNGGTSGNGGTPGVDGKPGGPGPGPKPIPQPPAPKPPMVIATTAALEGMAQVTGSAVSVVISCTAAPGHNCPLSAQLVTSEVAGKLAGIARRRRTRSQQVVVGSSNATLGAGQTQKLTVSLNGQGQKLLSRFGHLPVTLTVTLNPSSGSQAVITTQRLTFKATHKKHHR